MKEYAKMVIVVIFLTLVIIQMIINQNNIEKRAIEKHAAQYSTDSGTFTWTDKNIQYIVEGK